MVHLSDWMNEFYEQHKSEDPYMLVSRYYDSYKSIKNNHTTLTFELNRAKAELEAILLQHFIPVQEYCELTGKSSRIVIKEIKEAPFVEGVEIDGRYYVEKSKIESLT